MRLNFVFYNLASCIKKLIAKCLVSGLRIHAYQRIHTRRTNEQPGMVRQEVYVSAPYGCKSGTASFGMPIKVESVVEYGLPSSGAGSGRKVVHATYAAF